MDYYSLIKYGATWALIENMLLAATAEGLGYAIHIPVGYPTKNAEVPTQVSATVEEKVHWNKR